MTVLIYATRGDYTRTVESFRRIGGVEPVVIGDGEPFSWQGRVVALHRWCAEHPGEVVLHADAFDVCCVRRIPKDLAATALTFSAEANCWPDAHVAETYPPCDTRYRFLNGGVWIGSTESYVRMVEERGLLSGLDESGTDQRAYTQAYLNGAGIVLDHGCKICHNRYKATDDWEISDGIYWVKSTGTAPLVVHGNGGSDIAEAWEAFGV
jgi:hypothetical protein